MSTIYYCQNRRRGEFVDDHATINGIQYLEVLDQDAIPLNSPQQQTLLVRCYKDLPASLDKDNVRITGGVRITPINVEWARRASDASILAAEGLINASEEAYFTSLDDPARVLLVRTEDAGDFSTYTLQLLLSPTSELPPADFDPVLSEIAFSFKVECPSDFDCAPKRTCPPEAVVQPEIDYLAKDYTTFRRVLLDRLSVLMPGWKERNPADLGIALVELLAYSADTLSYYQDAVATEAYLGTARQRESLRRHARLLDYAMHEGCNARTWVCFTVDSGGDGQVLSAWDPVSGEPARLSTRLTENALLTETEFERRLEAQKPVIFELMHDLPLYAAHNEIKLHTWGDNDCCLPRGATRAVLQDDASARLRLRPGDVLIFEQVIDPITGRAENADPARRQAVRLTRVHPEAVLQGDGTRTPGPLHTDELLDQPIVEIEWDAQDALRFPVCVSTVIDGIAIPDITVVRGNVVLADHGYTIPGETLPAPQNTMHRYRPQLQKTDLTYRQTYSHSIARGRPAAAALDQDPRRSLPAVTLTGGGETWTPQLDLLDSDRFAADFVVEISNRRRAALRFGNNVYGKAPAPASQLNVTYRIGNGKDGNIGAEALTHLVANISGVTGVRNPLAARGGTQPETPEEVRNYAPQAFRTQERAVTEADYAAIIQRHPQVQKAVATRRWTGSWYTMFISVDFRGGLTLTSKLEDDLRTFLESYRLAGHDVEIDEPHLVPLEIIMTVCVKPDAFRSQVKQALLETFGRHGRPNGQRGFFHPDNWTFGQPVYLSQIIAAAMDVPGVKWVDLNDKSGSPHRFQRWGRSANDEIARGMIDIDRLEIAQLDNDPSQPENGRIEFLMEGGL
jgi:hypothetical protein